MVFFSIASNEHCTIRVNGNFSIVFEETNNDLIYDIFMVPVENNRSIICFTKSQNLNATSFEIFADGKFIAEVENKSERTQTVEIELRPSKLEINPKFKN